MGIRQRRGAARKLAQARNERGWRVFEAQAVLLPGMLSALAASRIQNLIFAPKDIWVAMMLAMVSGGMAVGVALRKREEKQKILLRMARQLIHEWDKRDFVWQGKEAERAMEPLERQA